VIKQSIRRRIVSIAAGLIILMVATSVLSMIMVGRVGHLSMNLRQDTFRPTRT
jgi:ABC-type amino acid transport system permease subunit